LKKFKFIEILSPTLQVN